MIRRFVLSLYLGIRNGVVDDLEVCIVPLFRDRKWGSR